MTNVEIAVQTVMSNDQMRVQKGVLLSVPASREPGFRRYPSNGRIDQNETSAQEVLARDLAFRDIILLYQKIKI